MKKGWRPRESSRSDGLIQGPAPDAEKALSPMTESTHAHTIRQVLAEHARLSVDLGTLRETDDLYQAGMTSHSSVNLMLALEDAFDVEFPDSMLKRSVF